MPNDGSKNAYKNNRIDRGWNSGFKETGTASDKFLVEPSG